MIWDGIVFTSLALVVLAYFVREWNKEQDRKARARDHLKFQVENALLRRDLNDLRRIRVVNSNALDELDAGLSERLDAAIDDIFIEQDNARKFGEIKS